jgi:hydrogenase-4 component B
MSAYLLSLLVLLPFLCGFAVYPVGRRSPSARNILTTAVTAVEFILSLLLFGMQGMEGGLEGVCGFGLHFTANGFGSLLGVLTTFLWLTTVSPSQEYFAHGQSTHPDRYYLFYLLTLGAMLGVSLSADLYTTFVFFEIMSFTSYVWVVQNEKPFSIRAADSYLAIAVMGGLVMLMGVFLLYDMLGTLELDRLAELAAAVPAEKRGLLYAAGGCCLFGFGAKAGMFPLHVWMPKAYPASPDPASALLSGILSKAGVFGVAVVSCQIFLHDSTWGLVILLFGVVTMVVGAVLGIFSVDLKRTLAGSSMSQIGFILVGMGMQGLLGTENTLAVWGTVLHLVNHSLIKLILFVAAGVVCNTVGSTLLNDVRGFGRGKPWLMLVFLAAGLSVSGVPLTSGYVSKTLLHESIVEYIHVLATRGVPIGLFRAVEALFLFSGGLTFAYMTKLFITLFVEKPAPEPACT